MLLTGCNIRRASLRRVSVVGTADVAIRDPLPDIAAHIFESERVRKQAADGVGETRTVITFEESCAGLAFALRG